MRIARLAMIAVALIASAWFLLGIRQAHEISAATAIVSHPKPLRSYEVRRASALLDHARTLNPDLEVEVLRARLALAQDQAARARAILIPVTRREPKNLGAWVWLGRASGDSPVTYYSALIAIRTLLPAVPVAR